MWFSQPDHYALGSPMNVEWHLARLGRPVVRHRSLLRCTHGFLSAFLAVGTWQGSTNATKQFNISYWEGIPGFIASMNKTDNNCQARHPILGIEIDCSITVVVNWAAGQTAIVTGTTDKGGATNNCFQELVIRVAHGFEEGIAKVSWTSTRDNATDLFALSFSSAFS